MMLAGYDNLEGRMAKVNDWNAGVVAEFRANEGRVSGQLEGAPLALVHHTGRNSGEQHVNPMMYLAADNDDDLIYVFASKSGAPPIRTGITT